MTDTQKIMTCGEIIEFISNMPFNTAYAAIAEGYEDNGNISGIEPYGWWSVLKVKYADAESLIFDYFGGCSPVIYCIDGVNGEDTVEFAVDEFLNDYFNGVNDKYVVDTKLENLKENTYLNAVDTVCMDCDYADEEICANCPVRKTVDRLMNKEEIL